jgi:hypothetical protein
VDRSDSTTPVQQCFNALRTMQANVSGYRNINP